jgi:hypothetical protein
MNVFEMEVVSLPGDPRASRGFVPAWGAILSGAIGGFATTIVLATLGAALGLSIGAATVNEVSDGRLALGIGAGAMVWMLVSAIVVGAVGGALLASTSRSATAFRPGTWGTVTWAVGIALAALLGAAGSVGAASTGSTALALGRTTPMTSFDTLSSDRGTPREASFDARDEASVERAVALSATTAWIVVASQLLGLFATILVAKMTHERLTGARAQEAAMRAAPR